MPRRRIRSKEHAQRRQATRRRRIKFYGITSLVIIGLLIGVTHWSTIQIKEVSAESSEGIPSEQIISLTKDVLDEPLLGVISRENILLLPREEIQERLQGISPRIKNVDIDLTSLRSVEVVVTDRQPVAEVCRKATSKCLLADETGFLLGRAGNLSASSTKAELLHYETSEELGIKDQFLTTRSFKALESFTDALEEIEFYPQKVTVGEYGDVAIVTTNEEGVESTNTNSVVLKVNVHEDLSGVLQNLQTVIDKESFVAERANGEEEPVSPFALEYIDLRFENKIFYR